MADDDARARRTTRATTGAKKATVKRAATPPVRKAAARKAAPPAKAVPPPKAAPAKRAAPAANRAGAPRKAAPAAKAARTTKAAPSGQGRGAILAPRAKKAPSFRPAAEHTVEDDWSPPAPEPVREDPHARIRSVLRAAALEVEGKAPPAARPAPPRARPPQTDEEVTRVLVAPAPPEEDEWLAEDELDEELDAEELEEEEVELEEVAAAVEDDSDDDDLPEDDDDEWSAPEILEEDDDEMLTVASAPAVTLSAPAPSGVVTPAPTPSTPPPPTTDFTPPPFEAKPAREKGERKAGRSRLKVLVLVVAALVAAAAVIVGAIWAYNKFRDEGIDYSKLRVGDCFVSSTSNEIRGIDVKPCSEPHNSEIFFIVTHPAGPTDAYPGKDTLVQYAADNCLGQPLTEYLGVPLEQSKLKDFEIVPQESAWKDGRRALVCGLDTGGEGDITGSVKGTRR